jgi:hypothetical protein
LRRAVSLSLAGFLLGLAGGCESFELRGEGSEKKRKWGFGFRF